jgi:ClpP class serine protease
MCAICIQLSAVERAFTPEEQAYFAASAMASYESFVRKAAMSRDMTVDVMHRRAQGRVWTGLQGKRLGLVDKIGGLYTAVGLARDYIDFNEAERKAFIVSHKKARSDKELKAK